MTDKLRMRMLFPMLLIAALTLMVTPNVMASSGEIWLTDAQGNPKGEFDIFDDVYMMGRGFPDNTIITVRILDPDQGITIASVSVTTESDGSIPVTLVWAGPLSKITTTEGTIYRLRDYQYEIWIDSNLNTLNDQGDTFNVFTVTYPENQTPNSTPGPVIPELGTIILMIAMFGALATAYLSRKRIL